MARGCAGLDPWRISKKRSKSYIYIYGFGTFWGPIASHFLILFGDRFGVVLGHLWAHFEDTFGTILGPLGALGVLLGRLGSLLGCSWGALGVLGVHTSLL